ncbi:TIM-barrel enzyme family protein [Xylariales sp. PMI_506]|nr:TIM-barrel enzyme family protein [Xylariales sp. PMI_506]
MPRPTKRDDVVAHLRAAVARGEAIVGAGAGTGLSAKCVESGGGHLIIIYNSGRFRMAGRGSLAGMMPYGDANKIVVEMASEVLPIVKSTPVLAGVCGTDPFREMPYFIAQLKSMGFSGVQNFPTVGLIDAGSVFRQNLEETGMGYDQEVDMIREAHNQDFFTCSYVFSPDDAVKMTRAGSDVIVAHMGLTTSGTIGAQTGISLDESVTRVQDIRDAAVEVREDIIVLCHGGPIAEPEDAAFVLSRTRGVQGFFGASSMERLPTEKAIKSVTEDFRKVKLER